MHMRMKWIMLGFLFVFIVIFTPHAVVYAEEPEQSHSQIAASSIDYPITAFSLSGYQSTAYQYFTVENYWNVNNITLYLSYHASPLINQSTSSLTFSLNNTPFHSEQLIVNDDHQIKITIPKNLITEGVNTLKIEAERKTNNDQFENVCTTEQYTSNWLSIKEPSLISLNYSVSSQVASIKEFAARFNGIDTLQQKNNTVILNEDAASTELESSIHIITGMASHKRDTNEQIPLLSYSDKDAATKDYVLYVGYYSSLPAAIKKEIGSHTLTTSGLIKLIKINGQHVLVVTSDSDQLLHKSAQYVANGQLMEQTTSAEKFVFGNTNVFTPAFVDNNIITLTESGDTLTGPLHRSQNYFVDLPANQMLGDASKIRLELRYAQNMNFERSLVTVLINNEPIGSKKLSEVTANHDIVELTIPNTLDVHGNFTITVAFDLEIEDLFCTAQQNETPWAHIVDTSIMQLNTFDINEQLFNYYPASFIRAGGLNSIAIILPDNVGRSELLAISNIFNLIGQYTVTNHGTVHVYDHQVDNETLANKQLIAIGNYQNNVFIKNNNEQLYFQYNEDGTSFISNEKMSIESSYGQKLGTLQLLNSPISKGFGLMVVTAPNPLQYVYASELISTESNLWKIYGDSVIIDPDGQIRNYRFKLDEPQITKVTNIFERSDIRNFVLSAFITIIIALIALIFIVRKYWKLRR